MHWEKWNNKHGAAQTPPQGVVIMNLSLLVILRMSLSLCKARPHVLPGVPEWAVCWNIRSADLHPPGLVETWYEWNLHTQDILFHWNMSTWIHFSALSWPAQKVSSASFYTPEQKERRSRMTALSPCFCSVIDCFPVVYVTLGKKNTFTDQLVCFLPCFWLIFNLPIPWHGCLVEDINKRDENHELFLF